MSKYLNYRELITNIYTRGKTRSVDRIEHDKLMAINDLVERGFTWADTVEGAYFWAYVSRRLSQLGEGYGWKD